MNTNYELKKVVLGSYVFVSDSWVSNASFAIRKDKVQNVDDFSSEKIFNLLSTYKGMNSDFSKTDEDFQQYINCSFDIEYKKSNVCLKNEKETYTIFSDGEKYILVDSVYVDYFDLNKLYGSSENNVVYVNDPDKIDFFVADVDAEFDKVIVKKFIDFGKSDSKSEKKMNKFFK